MQILSGKIFNFFLPHTPEIIRVPIFEMLRLKNTRSIAKSNGKNNAKNLFEKLFAKCENNAKKMVKIP